MSKCKVIAVANQKGDVDKTTTTENVVILFSLKWKGSIDY